MGTNKQQLAVSGFQGGLNTESSALNSLPSEFQDESVNIDLFNDGSVMPRRGLNIISTNEYTTKTGSIAATNYRDSPNTFLAKFKLSSNLVQEYLLSSAIGTNKYIIVHQTDTASLQNIAAPSFSLNLSTHCAAEQRYNPMMFAQTDTRVYVAGLLVQPGYITLSGITPSITFFDVFTRNITTTSTPSSRVSDAGNWYECAVAHTSSAPTQPSLFPENWHQLAGPVPAGTTAWSAASVSYVTNLVKTFDKTATVTSSTLRPDSVCLFANRLWMALGSTLYFSQVIEDTSDTVRRGIRFYQDADPYSLTDSDVVDSDGGTAPIQGSGVITGLYPLGKSLIVTTTDGVFQVAGPDGIFSATNYVINKVLTEKVESKYGAVAVGEVLIVAGIEAMWNSKRADTVFGVDSISFDKISETKQQTSAGIRITGIKNHYASITRDAKKAARLLYNPSNSTVYYFYNKETTNYDTTKSSTNIPGYYTSWLKYDTIGSSFTAHQTIDNGNDNAPYVAAPFILTGSTSYMADTVTANSVAVVSNAVAVTTLSSLSSTGAATGLSEIFFLGARQNLTGSQTFNYAFGELESDNVTDWSYDEDYEYDYPAKIICGITLLGNIARQKSSTYLLFIFKKVETGILVDYVDTNPGGCLVSAGTNFATSSLAKRWVNQLQIYKPYRLGYSLTTGANDGYSHTYYKLKLRSRGLAIQFVIEKDPGKDFHLLGFSDEFYGQREGKLAKQV